jgi:hypothetical protein
MIFVKTSPEFMPPNLENLVYELPGDQFQQEPRNHRLELPRAMICN